MRTASSNLSILSLLALSFTACGGTAPDATDGGEDLSSRTVLRIHYPESGHAITVRGSTGSLNWNSGVATETSDGLTGTITVSKVSGTLQFKPLIDDETWSLGPNYAVKAGSSIVTGCASLWQSATFGNVGLMSPSTWWTNDWINGQVSASTSAADKPLRVYVDSGDAGDSNDDVTETLALDKAYKAAGYPSTDYLVGHGDTHTESSWARRLPGALHYLLGPRAALP